SARARDVAGNQGGATTRAFTVQRDAGSPTDGGGGGGPGGGGGDGSGGGPGGGGGTAASITGLRVSPAAFRAARRGGAVAAAAGAKVRFVLTAAGTVRFTVQRLPRRRAGHPPPKPTTLRGAFHLA